MQSTILGLDEDQGPRHSATIPVLNIILYLLMVAISNGQICHQDDDIIQYYTYILTRISN